MSQYTKKDLPPKKDKIVVNWKLLKRKARAEYSYLKLELEHQAQVFEEAKKAFNLHFDDEIDKKKEAKWFTKNKEDDEKKSENKKIPLNIDKAYKKIALKAHPDKKTGDDEIFKNLREAVNENDIDTILFIASEYDIDLEKDAKVDLYKFYTDAIDSIKDKISYQHSTLAWQWYHGNEQVKEHVTATVKTLYGK